MFQEGPYDTNDFGSLLSLDSLENEVLDRPAPPARSLEASTATASSSSSSLDPKRAQAAAKPIQDGGGLLRSSRSGVQEPPRSQLDRGVHGGPCQVTGTSSNLTEATPRCTLLSLCEALAASETRRSGDKVTTVTDNNNDHWMPDSYFLDREEGADLGTASKPLSATELFFPAESLAKSHEAFRQPISVPNNDRNSHATNRQAVSGVLIEEKDSLQDTINNLNTFSSDWPRVGRFKDARTLQQESSSHPPLDTSRHQGSLTGAANTANTADTANRSNNANSTNTANSADTANTASTANTAGISFKADPAERHVRFLKGILKKQSKYAPAPRGPSGGLGKLVFAKHVAKSIRDSLELTRGKRNCARNWISGVPSSLN